MSNCKIEFASEYEHINYYELDTIPGIHDDKNRLNFKFFAIGKRDVHVLFTPIKDPTDTTMVYEFGKFFNFIKFYKDSFLNYFSLRFESDRWPK